MIVALRRSGSAAALGLTLALASAPVLAQDGTEVRLRKVEAEVRALQRKVFPDGAGKYFEAEIRPAAPTAALPAPTSGPVTDLLARVDAVESQLARLTAQVEENINRTGKLEARLAVVEGGGAAAAVTAAVATPAPAAAAAEPAAAPRSITGSLAANTAAMTQAAAASPGDRLAAVGAIAKPESGDKGEDEYLYGYRLWEAKFYPEAAQQLKATVDKYPKHKRISYARNLLGRAYLEDGKPGTAAQVFLQNYQADKAGERAPDSLLFLAVAMTRLKETQRACVALQELSEAYPAEVVGRLANQYADARAAVKCS